MHDQILDLLKALKEQGESEDKGYITEVNVNADKISVQVKGDFDKFITNLGYKGSKYHKYHADEDLHTISVIHNGIKYYAIINMLGKYHKVEEVKYKWCYDCVNYVEGPSFCGYSEISCKIHGSLDVDQKERHPDITANTCKDYKLKRSRKVQL